MSYSYNVISTTNPLSRSQLYEGMVVCFSNVQTNPNNTGILEKVKDIGGGTSGWFAIINGVKYIFDLDGYNIADNTIRLYGVLSEGDVDPTVSTAKSREASAADEANTVSLTYMTPKDYFACEALNAFIQRIENPLSMNDGMIALLAAKCYKIAQSMAEEAYGSRQNDKKSTDASGTNYVNVNELSLQTNTERILYNLNESLKDNTKVMKDTGIKINGTPNVNVSNSPNVTVSNTPDVYVTNMPSVPSEPVSITGTVSVDNFPESE